MRDKKGTHRFWGVLFYLALMVTIVSASYAGVRFCSNLVTEQSYERLRDAAEAFAVGTKNGQQGKEKNKAAKRMERESEQAGRHRFCRAFEHQSGYLCLDSDTGYAD